jgi:hypothetical protein
MSLKSSRSDVFLITSPQGAIIYINGALKQCSWWGTLGWGIKVITCHCEWTLVHVHMIDYHKRELKNEKFIMHDVYSMLALALPKCERSNRSSGLIRNGYLLNKQMIIDNSWLGLANTQDERFTPYQDQREWLLTFGLGIIFLQGVSRRKSLAGVNIMYLQRIEISGNAFTFSYVMNKLACWDPGFGWKSITERYLASWFNWQNR